MKAVIVLAMHGVPPSDFPPEEAGEFFRLHSRLEHARGPEREALLARHEALEERMRAWPRTPANDPFYFGSLELAAQLTGATACDVIVAFNEFCGPSLNAALDQAAARGAARVIVITPMMTRGGGHSESDIPGAIRRAEQRHPGVPFLYAWPFDVSQVAEFLGNQVSRFMQDADAAIQRTG